MQAHCPGTSCTLLHGMRSGLKPGVKLCVLLAYCASLASCAQILSKLRELLDEAATVPPAVPNQPAQQVREAQCPDCCSLAQRSGWPHRRLKCCASLEIVLHLCSNSSCVPLLQTRRPSMPVEDGDCMSVADLGPRQE